MNQVADVQGAVEMSMDTASMARYESVFPFCVALLLCLLANMQSHSASATKGQVSVLPNSKSIAIICCIICSHVVHHMPHMNQAADAQGAIDIGIDTASMARYESAFPFCVALLLCLLAKMQSHG